ncbi:MAG: ABC transporter substrate-binding protein [Calditrichaeota bacterium]|nr:ABC transporter substrate-binding protein [Calditrichota bacterium]
MMFPAVVLKLHKLIYNSFQPTLWMLLAILILFSQTIATTTPVKTDLDQVSLALKWKHQFQFAGYYAAVEKGFYKEAGLDVTILEAVDGKESYKSVIQGKAEFGTAMSDLVLLRSEGHPVVAMAAIFQHSPLVFLTPKLTGIRNIHELSGKRIALEAHAEELLAYLENEGIPADNLIIEPHSYNTIQLINGTVDAMSAYSTDEPYMLFKENIDYNIFTPRSGGIDFYGDVLYTTEDQIKNHPERVAAFHDATLKGWQYAMTHQEEIIDLILSKYSKRHSREHLIFEAERSAQLMMMDVIEIGYMNPGRWQHIANTYIQMHAIPADFSLEGFIYDRNPDPDLTRLYYGLAISILIALLVMVIGGYFYHLNRTLKREMTKRKETEKDLIASEMHLNVLMSNLPGIAYRCTNNVNREMLFLSQGCQQLTGYPIDDLINSRNVPFSDLILTEDKKQVTKQLTTALTKSSPFTAFYRIKSHNGTVKWVWDQGQIVPSISGEGDLIEGLITDITEQKKVEKEREQLILDLQNASSEIKMLRGILPICSYCKKIRDDTGYWNQIEQYISDHSDADFTHGICPNCIKEHFPGYAPND